MISVEIHCQIVWKSLFYFYSSKSERKSDKIWSKYIEGKQECSLSHAKKILLKMPLTFPLNLIIDVNELEIYTKEVYA